MQEIRDYIYGMLNGKWFTTLFRLREHKRVWEFIEHGTLEQMEHSAKRQKGSGDFYHIVGGVQEIRISSLPGASIETVRAEDPPFRMFYKIIAPPKVATFGENNLTPRYSVWGIWYDKPNWVLIGLGLPKVEDLEKLRKRGLYDMIRVCKYVPEYTYLESCEMRLFDKEGNRLATPTDTRDLL